MLDTNTITMLGSRITDGNPLTNEVLTMGKPEMSRLVIYIPRALKDQLDAIKDTNGVSISLQARHSLNLWVRRVNKDPNGAWGLIGMIVNDRYRGGKVATPEDSPQNALQRAIYLLDHLELDPEPDITTDKYKWASWAARQGNAAVKATAAGYFGTPEGDPDADAK